MLLTKTEVTGLGYHTTYSFYPAPWFAKYGKPSTPEKVKLLFLLPFLPRDEEW